MVSADAGATRPFLDYTHMYAFDTLDCGHVLVHSFEINVWSKFAEVSISAEPCMH